MVEVNVGTVDRVIRFIIGIGLLVWGYLTFQGGNSGLGIGLMVFSLVPFVTSVIKFCPLYSLLGISTCPNKALRS